MAPASAHFGEPPANDHDYMIIKSILVFSGAGGLLDPAGGIPLALAAGPSVTAMQEPYQTKVPDIIIGNVLGIFLIIMCTGLRLSIRASTNRLHLGWDDWAIIAAAFFAIAHLSFVIATAARGGLGKHLWDVTYSEGNVFAMTDPWRQTTFFLTVATAKMSIALFYMRLNGFTSKTWMVAHWAVFASVVALALASLFIWVFACDDVTSYWYPLHNAYRTTRPKCINVQATLIALNVWHVLTDALLLVVPVMMLWQVKMKLATKFRVWIAGIVGCVNIAIAVIWTISNSWFLYDKTWNYVKVQNWGTAELVIGVITASLPVLSSMVSRMGSRFSRAVATSRLGRSSYFEKAKKAVRLRSADSIKLDDSIMLTRPATMTDAQDDGQTTHRCKVEFGGTEVEQIDVEPNAKSLDTQRDEQERKKPIVDVGHAV